MQRRRRMEVGFPVGVNSPVIHLNLLHDYANGPQLTKHQKLLRMATLPECVYNLRTIDRLTRP